MNYSLRMKRLLVGSAAGAMVLATVPTGIAAADAAAVCEDAPENDFDDVAESNSHKANIDCLAAYGITSGDAQGDYNPGDPVTRGQMATFIARFITQAESGSLDVPTDADDAFSDDDGTTHENAINYLASIDVVAGTGGDNYSPGATVTRGQMARFIVNALEHLGFDVPEDAEDAFDDDNGSTHEDMINILAELQVVSGFNDGTYRPGDGVSRQQMATYIIGAAGAADDQDLWNGEMVEDEEPAEGQVTVTPSSDATLANGAARSYTATFRNTDGTPYTGFVGIRLLAAEANGSPDWDTDNTGVVLEGPGGQEFNGFAGLDGEVTFVVRDLTGGANDVETSVVPVAWIDLDGDTDYGDDESVAPTEPYSLGGVTTFQAEPAPAAVAGTYADMTVDTVNRAANTFVATTDGDVCVAAPGTDETCTFQYGEDDIFLISGSASTLAAWEAALSPTDVVTATSYAPANAGVVTTFNITTDNPEIAPLRVTRPASAVTIDANSYQINGTGQPGYTVHVYAEDAGGTDGEVDAADARVGSATVASGGTWSVTVPLRQDFVNDFLVVQTATAAAPANGTAGVEVPNITEGAAADPTITASAIDETDGTVADTVDPGDVITLTFSEDVEVATGASITLQDQDGTVVTITCGTAGATCTQPADNQLELDVNFVFITSAGGDGALDLPALITATSGITDADGNAVDVAGSTGRLLDN